MKKILITILSITLLIIGTAANAADKGIKNTTTPISTLAILDTALDTSIPQFQGKIAYEVCILEWNSCPNGKSFMEGPGSSVMKAPLINNNGFDHGTQMVSAAISTNPNMQIVFVRIIGSTIGGVRQSAGERSIYDALDWVINNKDKFNIKAVSMSQGNHSLLNGVDYCPKKPNTEARVSKLQSMGVPVFFPSGNGRDYQKLDWPACIDNSISVGAVDQYGEPSSFSNYDPIKLDFLALGYKELYSPGGILKNSTGTSVAAQVAAASWIALSDLKTTFTYSQIYDLLTKTATVTKSGRYTSNKLINLQGAING